MDTSMQFMQSIKDEILRSPLAAISSVVGVVIAILSLCLAWFQFLIASAAPTASPSGFVATASGEVVLGNVLLVIAYFLAATIPAALLIRAVARRYDIAAFLASVPLAALVNFSVVLVIYLAPPRLLSNELFMSAHDLVLYASGAIYITFCGNAVLRNISIRSTSNGSDASSEAGGRGDGLGVLFLALVLLVLWGWLVFGGQTRLTRTFLPEITHTAEIKSVKNGT